MVWNSGIVGCLWVKCSFEFAGERAGCRPFPCGIPKVSLIFVGKCHIFTLKVFWSMIKAFRSLFFFAQSFSPVR